MAISLPSLPRMTVSELWAFWRLAITVYVKGPKVPNS